MLTWSHFSESSEHLELYAMQGMQRHAAVFGMRDMQQALQPVSNAKRAAACSNDCFVRHTVSIHSCLQ
eukprot:1144545-Pelagomonas_calceolata.AAC.12